MSFTDSREKLEADIREFAEENGWLYPMSGSQLVFNWLDRQAEITAEEAANAWESYSESVQDEVAGLQQQVGMLKAELDKWHAITASVKLPDYPMCEYQPNKRADLEDEIHHWLNSHVAVSVRTSEIEREALKWLDAQAAITEMKMHDHYRAELERRDSNERKITAERDALATDLNECMELNDKLSDEREKWRGTCGLMADAAHEIERILDDMEAK